MKKILILGAGVVGLSIGYELSKNSNLRIRIIDKNKTFGLENTSKNSQVIHSGVYYKNKSLKNKLCIQGKKLIYEFCKKYKIKNIKKGKLFLACTNKETKYLKILKKNAIKNGVKDVKIINSKNLKKIEPNLIGKSALLSPSSGIFDVKKFSKKLFLICKKRNVTFGFNIKNVSIKKKRSKFHTNIKNDKIYDTIINSAGMDSIKIAKKTFPKENFPTDKYVKGVYYKTKQNLGIKKIVYRAMLPGDTKERIDITPDVNGGYIIGPSVEKFKLIDRKKLKNKFFNGIKNHLRIVDKNKLFYFKEGIRPKIEKNKKNLNEDFYIKKNEKL